MTIQTTNVPRRYELDWLRVLAILFVFIYHCSLVFGPDPSSIKNATTYEFVNDWSDFAGIWGMPLIFVISGASVFYALGKARPVKYIKGNIARLLVPLVVGVFTHIAYQVYLEHLHQGTFSGSFIEFYPHYFDGLYAFGGNFAWMGLHLWYLEALFLFSLLCLPLYLWLKYRSTGQRVLQRLGNFLGRPVAIYLLALPATILFNLLNPDGLGTMVLGGWSIFNYLAFFISGFVIISSEQLQASIRHMRWVSLVTGIILWGVFNIIWQALGDPTFGSWPYAIGTTVWCLYAWCWLLAILGFGMRHLNFSTPFLKYANEAVLPFYILHQTVIFSLAIYVVQWTIPDLFKWVAILIPSFVISLVLYEFLVRRFNVLRFLFGMKHLVKPLEAYAREKPTIEFSSISHE